MMPGAGCPGAECAFMRADASLTFHRKECLQRYRDKKQRRHFSHKVRARPATCAMLTALGVDNQEGRLLGYANLKASP